MRACCTGYYTISTYVERTRRLTVLRQVFTVQQVLLSKMDIPQVPGVSSTSSSSTPVRPRKRKARPETWRRAVAKIKRARGDSFTSPTSGEVFEAAKQGPPCHCKRKCYDKYQPEELSRIFTCFWDLGENNLQDAYLHY